MLELILSRPREKKLTASAADLQFLVLDELHTYRGRQGADVAFLLRRVRELFAAEKLQCVGTSATLASRGTWQEQRAEVARLATRLFGDQVEGDDVIGETLERSTRPLNESDNKDVAILATSLTSGAKQPLITFEQLANDPVARWMEGTFGIMPEAGSNRLVRSRPIPLTGGSGAAERLAKLTNTPAETCTTAIADTLLAGATRVRHPQTDFPVFPFRLHQFVSRGDTLYTTVEAPTERYLTIHGQLFSPNDRSKILLPLCFCRECGQEYYSVYLLDDSGEQKVVARDPNEVPRKLLPRDPHDRTAVPSQIYQRPKFPFAVGVAWK